MTESERRLCETGREKEHAIYMTAKYGETKSERDDAVKILVDEYGFCTHYPGYTCDRDFPKACPACIKRTFTLQRSREQKRGE
jgi:hypothetical protein